MGMAMRNTAASIHPCEREAVEDASRMEPSGGAVWAASPGPARHARAAGPGSAIASQPGNCRGNTSVTRVPSRIGSMLISPPSCFTRRRMLYNPRPPTPGQKGSPSFCGEQDHTRGVQHLPFSPVTARGRSKAAPISNPSLRIASHPPPPPGEYRPPGRFNAPGRPAASPLPPSRPSAARPPSASRPADKPRKEC